jgi:hypothetical protein
MKRMNSKLLTIIFASLMLAFVSSCKDDEPEPVSTTNPVLNSNFWVTVDGNNVVVTTTLVATSMWVTDTNTNVATDFTDLTCTIVKPLAGDYAFTCSALVEGSTYTSEPFSAKIATSNPDIINNGVWGALTGGTHGAKTWKLDITSFVKKSIGDDGVETSVTSYGSEYFHAALDFYGDADCGGTVDNIWGPWGGTNIYGWGGTPEAGTITFNAITGKVTLSLTDGVYADGFQKKTDNGDGTFTINATPRVGDFSGAFNLVTYTRDPNFLTLTANNGGVSLWENMTGATGKYNYLASSFSAECGDLTFTSDLRMPMDKGRVGEEQFEATDLKNVMIMHCADSSLIVRAKRSWEGVNADGTHKESKCWLLYNYINTAFTYTEEAPTPLFNTEIVNADATAASIAGTYKFAPLTGEWVSFATKNTYGSYTAETEASTFASWGAADADAKYTAASKSTFTLEAGGNFSFSDVTYVDGAEVTTPYTGTYTINKGYITFSTSANITGFTGMISLSGTNMYVIATPANGTSGSLWIGQNNGAKEEAVAVQLVKTGK